MDGRRTVPRTTCAMRFYILGSEHLVQLIKLYQNLKIDQKPPRAQLTFIVVMVDAFIDRLCGFNYIGRSGQLSV